MHKSKKILSISLFLLLILIGCEKDQTPNLVTDNSEISVRSKTNSDTSRESTNFFDLNYTNDNLVLAPPDNGYYQVVVEAMSFIEGEFLRSNLYQDMERNSIYPCWVCAESEYIGFHNYYVPFYSLDTKILDGLLVVQKKDEEFSLVYITKIMVNQIHSRFPNDNSQYWSGIMEHFTGGIIGKSKKPKFNSRTEICKGTGVGCRCSISFINCGDEVLEYGAGSNWDCSGSCNGEGDGGDEGGGDEGGGDYDEGGPETVADIHAWTETYPGGGPLGTIDYLILWYEHCGSFEGSLDYEETDDGEFVIDEATGTIAIMNPRALYLQQIQSFINLYNIPVSDPQEIADMAGEVCAVSTLLDVFECLKCQYITPLGLSGEANWYLNENFEIVGGCNGDLSCIKSELVANSDCADELTSFISQYELNLTLNEMFLIIEGTGGLSGNCSFSFESDAWEIIESFLDFDAEETDEEFDPDWWPDCESWEYTEVAGGLYQSCAVLGLHIDVGRTFIDSNGNPHTWNRSCTYGTIYFEFPKVRVGGFEISPGIAALRTAQMWHEAEDLMELKFQYRETVPSSIEVQLEFNKQLKLLLHGHGARASRNPYYGYVPINPASYANLNYGFCY
ncbi:MAG: hypothetical protein ACJATI_002363 [Halioglobus sp.]|jgi:hypothetical protein